MILIKLINIFTKSIKNCCMNLNNQKDANQDNVDILKRMLKLSQIELEDILEYKNKQISRFSKNKEICQKIEKSTIKLLV